MALAIHFDQLIRGGKVKDCRIDAVGAREQGEGDADHDAADARAGNSGGDSVPEADGGRAGRSQRTGHAAHITAAIDWRQQREGWVALTK